MAQLDALQGEGPASRLRAARAPAAGAGRAGFALVSGRGKSSERTPSPLSSRTAACAGRARAARCAPIARSASSDQAVRRLRLSSRSPLHVHPAGNDAPSRAPADVEALGPAVERRGQRRCVEGEVDAAAARARRARGRRAPPASASGASGASRPGRLAAIAVGAVAMADPRARHGPPPCACCGSGGAPRGRSPCQVPSASLPSITGIDTDTPVSMAPQVRRHVVGPLVVVGVELVALGHQPRQPGLEVAPHRGVGALVDDHARRGVLHEDRAQPVVRGRCSPPRRATWRVMSCRPGRSMWISRWRFIGGGQSIRVAGVRLRMGS